MGLNIGNISGSLSALRSSPQFGRVRLPGRPTGASLPTSRKDDKGLGPFFRKQEEPQLRVGFGRGTLSPSGAALLTIDRTVDQVRRNIPTIEEIRARFRAHAAEANDESRRLGFERRERGTARRVEIRIPAASAQARNFISGLNEAASTAQARLRGEEPPQSDRGPTIRINGEDFAFGGGAAGSRLDVRV